MDWTSLLSSQRLCHAGYKAQESRSIFVQDHDRIVFSAPFRRLANKTQVQPLYEHDHVHHRLIHSIEVGSVGRSLAMRIGQWLAERAEIATDAVHSLADIVQAACVAHDIGNPPFGHSGEEAMGSWFAERFGAGHGLFADIPRDLRPEFTKFEGNAQGFRILTRLEMYREDGGMQLSKATLGAFSKYPVTAAVQAAVTGDGPAPYVGLKKFGVFEAERPRFEDVARTLGLPEEHAENGSWWRRHPLVFVVEAADDICYGIVDLEDAFTTGELPFDTVTGLLGQLCGAIKRDLSTYTQAEVIAYQRAIGIGKAIAACADAFIENREAIMAGSFSQDLVSASRLAPVFAEIKRVSGQRIFTAQRKTELEISGRRTIANVMDGILPVYEDLAATGWQADRVNGHSERLIRALDLDLRGVDDAPSALHALADFTSGMTDRYALRISRMLSGT